MKITQDHIDNLISNSKIEKFKAGLKTTIVHLTLPNGFEIVGSSTCVDPNEYDFDIGVSIALKRVEDQIWLLEGYLLQNNKS